MATWIFILHMVFPISSDLPASGVASMPTPAEAAESEAHVAMSQADALLFLTPQLRQADADLLASFRELSRGSDLTALNTVGVLSKVDKLAGPGEDPLEVGARLARRAEEQLHGLANRVHPVIGLLAETAGADAFTEADAQRRRAGRPRRDGRPRTCCCPPRPARHRLGRDVVTDRTRPWRCSTLRGSASPSPPSSRAAGSADPAELDRRSGSVPCGRPWSGTSAGGPTSQGPRGICDCAASRSCGRAEELACCAPRRHSRISSST